jgi:anaerobic selenocysteine-containing dehydrogenase
MERRDFLRFSAITGATAALDSCGNPEVQLIRFVPEEELVPGVAAWKPGLCTLCPAGCGTMVRVMEGETEVVRRGQHGLIQMGLAKKLEGNPRHPVSQGKLCPRGQAGLQVTYHPDRLKTPLQRSGPRGSGQFHEISWDVGIQLLLSQLRTLRSNRRASSLGFLSKPLRGQRRVLLARFLSAFGAPPPVTFELFDETVLRQANALSFGHSQLPSFDLARANYVISFGADFLSTWNSPVAQSVAYGAMRQERPGVRGKLVQVEPRLSQTGANADEWIPARPGTEGALALGLARVIMDQRLRPANAAGNAGALIAGWTEALPGYSPPEVERKTGIPAEKVIRLAQEMATHPPAVGIVGGAALAHSNALPTALAVNALNALLDNIGRPGGVYFTPRLSRPEEKTTATETGPQSSHAGLRALVEEVLVSRPFAPEVLLLYETNPVFATPPDWHVREALLKVPYLVSFGSFLDETSVLADLILPDHSTLESWLDDIPEAGTTQAVVSLAPPAMRPLHDTRAMPDVLLDLARQLGEGVASALPWKTYEEMLKSYFEDLGQQRGTATSANAEEFWKKAQEQGSWWSTEVEVRGAKSPTPTGMAYRLAEPQFDGNAKDFPFHFHPYASPLFYDGSLAHLPWMQETPDPLSAAMWGTWVEINPKTAEGLNIRPGDLVEVSSQHGKLQAPAVLSPGIAPDVVAMPVGQGHQNFTRYASGRGANPLSILAPGALIPETGTLTWAATRVRVSRVGMGKLVLFAGGMRERPYEHEHR